MSIRSDVAFTLVELLVVITIIVVLISLLTPAMDQAIYQAKLAVCSATLDGIATTSVTYTFDNKRLYPDLRPPDYGNAASVIRDSTYYSNQGEAKGQMTPLTVWDLRPAFTPYMSLDNFLDPLSGDIDFRDEVNRPEAALIANYSVHTGWGITGFKYMKRLGDGFSFADSLSNPNNPPTYQFRVIAADGDWRAGAGGGSSHPDESQVRSFSRLQNDRPEQNPVNEYMPILHTFTSSGWSSGNPRGHLVDNFAYDDGSVRRVNDVEIEDERMARVAGAAAVYVTGGYAAGNYKHLPKQ